MEITKTTLGDQRVPLDGSLFTTSSYLETLSGNSDMEFYRRYLDHLKYFTSIFRFVGDENLERLNMDIFRQLIEFGSVVICKIKGRPVVGALVHVEYNLFKDIEYIDMVPAREGYGYRKDKKTIRVKGDRCVFIKENFQGLPFIFYWNDILETIINLRKSATTASIASIKKFKRNLQNNHSEISKLETDSMLNPNTPYIDNIVLPSSYLDEVERSARGDTSSDNQSMSTTPNSIEFNSVGSGTQELWANLKAYMEFEYFQKGRRINTNKKNERNIAREIDTETINFDILESELYHNLECAAKDLSSLFGVKVEVESIAQKIAEDAEMEIENDQNNKI